MIKKFNIFFLEKNNNEKTIINLIFSDSDIEKIYEIKERITSEYLDNLEIDSFTMMDNSELIDYINKYFIDKGLLLDESDIDLVMKLIDKYIRL